MTAEALLAFSDDDRRRELVSGFVVSQPPASFQHGGIAAEVFRRLSVFVHRHDLGNVVSTETGFLLARDPDTVRAPEVAFVSHARIARAGSFRGYFPGAPDLAVEVLSPGDRPADVQAKVGDYLAAGTAIVWVIDPTRREAMVHRSSLGAVLITEEGTLEGEEILPGFAVTVERLLPRR